MNIQFNDTMPAQKNYVAMPQPLYPEVKAYFEDLLNQNFIRKSNSSLCKKERPKFKAVHQLMN